MRITIFVSLGHMEYIAKNEFLFQNKTLLEPSIFTSNLYFEGLIPSSTATWALEINELTGAFAMALLSIVYKFSSFLDYYMISSLRLTSIFVLLFSKKPHRRFC